MSNYKEIVTKAVLSKGKKLFTTNHQVTVDNPSTILGCWVINHNFQGVRDHDKIVITGSYDVNIWYSYDHDTKTNVVSQTEHYTETIHMREHDEVGDEEIIVRSLKQPSCVHTNLDANTIQFTIEKELGIELVGDIKVKIEANMEEDPWDEIGEEESIKEEIKEDFIHEENIL